MVSYFPLISGIISAVFMILLGVQYIRRRKKHQLVWTIALLLFTLTSLLAFVSEMNGWTVPMYQLYYFTVSPPVALMGTGTLYLLVDKPWGKYFLIYTIIMSALFLALILAASVDTTQFVLYSPTGTYSPSDIGSKAMPSTARTVSILLNAPGGLLLIIGALYSFWLDKSKKYSLLIGLGGIINFISGSLSTAGTYRTYFFVFTTVGILLLFLGFLLSSEYVKKREKQ